MRIDFLFVVPERLESLLEISTHGRWDVVVDARLIVPVLVIVVVGEIGDFTRPLYARCSTAESVDGL